MGMSTQDMLNGYQVPESWVQGFTAELQQAPAFSKLNRGPHAWPGKFRSAIFLTSLAHGVEIRLRMVIVGFLTTEPSHRQVQSLAFARRNIHALENTTLPKAMTSHFPLPDFPPI
jgi:hypothetical protein